MKNKFILPALVIVAAGTALLGGGLVHAQTTNTDGTQAPSIIQRLVERFGLKTSDVQAVFDEDRTAHQEEMQAKATARLNQLVTDGKITEAQKQLIIAKRAEMEADKPAFDSSLTPNQRKTEMETKKTELDAWAKANGIDVQYLFGGFGERGFGGHHGMMGGMPPIGTTPTTSNS